MSGNVQEIASAIKQIMEAGGQVLGSRLSAALKTRVPGWSPADYGLRSLREVVATHVPDVCGRGPLGHGHDLRRGRSCAGGAGRLDGATGGGRLLARVGPARTAPTRWLWSGQGQRSAPYLAGAPFRVAKCSWSRWASTDIAR